MRVIISGSTGLVGSATVRRLEGAGHRVRRLVRPDTDLQAPKGTQIQWDIKAGTIDSDQLEDHDAVVHLAGEPILGGKWDDEKKKRVHDSRIDSTNLLAKTLSNLVRPPKVFVCASAIGYYGNRGDEELAEDSAPGNGVLAETCKAWEAACQPIAEAGIRVVNLRIGAVLSPFGGALQMMLPIFKLGLGGKVGSGQQFFSWIARDDVAGIIEFAIENDDLSGPVNTVAPNPVRNVTFTKAMGRVLKRPTILPVPEFAVRMRFGDVLSDELLLASTRVIPQKLVEAGYPFEHSTVEKALRDML